MRIVLILFKILNWNITNKNLMTERFTQIKNCFLNNDEKKFINLYKNKFKYLNRKKKHC